MSEATRRPKLRVGVLISGRGTDLQSIIDASEAGEINAEVVVVVSNDPDAYGLERAKKHGIPGIAISHKGLKREEHERKIADVLHEYKVELVVLAGYIRVLTPWFVNEFRNKIINIHPALLPLFGGMGMWGEHVHHAVLESGMKVSGCTVHVVNEIPDGGAIIAQRTVPVEEDDTEATLAARVLEEEHKLLPYVVGLFADGRVKIEGNRAKVLPASGNSNNPSTISVNMRGTVETKLREIRQHLIVLSEKIDTFLSEKELYSMMKLAEHSLSDFLGEEPDIYAIEDLRVRYK